MNAIRMACPPALDQETGRTLFDTIARQRLGKGLTLTLDCSGTQSIDSRGSAWLVAIAERVQQRHGALQLEGAHGNVAEYLELVAPGLTHTASASRTPPGFFEEIGHYTLKWAAESRDFLNLCVDAVYWTVLAPFEGRGFRWGLLVEEIHEMGTRAVRIVALMNFLLGLIIAMLSAKQVENFGVQIYVADLIMIGFARELASIMTAVVVSARTGAAITAEISTMKVQEEIDALRGMGLNVNQFLVAPKLLALLIAMPCLTIIGLLAGIMGGALWGVFILDFQPSIWFEETLNAAHLDDLMQGFLKCFVFAVVIALVGCHNGFRVEGGSRGVGLMTTRSVVMDIFMIICIDIVFALIFYYLIP